MPTFIKTGLWFKGREGHKGSLNLEDLIKSTPANYQDLAVTTEPSTPPTGYIRIWVDSSGTLMVKDDTGTVKEVQFVNL